MAKEQNYRVEAGALGPYRRGDVVARTAVEALGEPGDYLRQGVVSLTAAAPTRINEAVPPRVAPPDPADEIAALRAEAEHLAEACERHQRDAAAAGAERDALAVVNAALRAELERAQKDIESLMAAPPAK